MGYIPIDILDLAISFTSIILDFGFSLPILVDITIGSIGRIILLSAQLTLGVSIQRIDYKKIKLQLEDNYGQDLEVFLVVQLVLCYNLHWEYFNNLLYTLTVIVMTEIAYQKDMMIGVKEMVGRKEIVGKQKIIDKKEIVGKKKIIIQTIFLCQYCIQFQMWQFLQFLFLLQLNSVGKQGEEQQLKIFTPFQLEYNLAYFQSLTAILL
ncbi:unnamed protein product [Paramecium sonneborni]|uniref:Uncharacterized protein n=1 Tax=Paramecium sonneborni TaxID=65129 RepID=A0A8S1RVN8_9CILI|nr:unnamed protein product [Paramecium sonneborni]